MSAWCVISIERRVRQSRNMSVGIWTSSSVAGVAWSLRCPVPRIERDVASGRFQASFFGALVRQGAMDSRVAEPEVERDEASRVVEQVALEGDRRCSFFCSEDMDELDRSGVI